MRKPAGIPSPLDCPTGQYSTGWVARRARLDTLRDRGNRGKPPASIRTALQGTLIYGPAWVVGYRGDIPTVQERVEKGVADVEELQALLRELRAYVDAAIEQTSVDEEIEWIRREVKREFFESKQ